MLGFSVLKIVGLLLSIFSVSYSPFVVGRFLIGIGVSGTFLPAFVLGKLSSVTHVPETGAIKSTPDMNCGTKDAKWFQKPFEKKVFKTRSSATAERQRVSYTRLSRLTH